MDTNKSLHLTHPQHHFPCSVLRATCVFSPEAIRRKVELEWGTEDEEYLEKVERNVRRSLQEHLPDVVVYNAGTDVLEGDRLGGLSISPAVRPNMGATLRIHMSLAWAHSDCISYRIGCVARVGHGSIGSQGSF